MDLSAASGSRGWPMVNSLQESKALNPAGH